MNAERAHAYTTDELLAALTAQAAATPAPGASPREALRGWIGAIDRRLSAQVNEILHHPQLQKLEATWRGLHYLVSNTPCGELLRIRVLNVTRRELLDDLTNPDRTFDQTETFQQVYWEEYGRLGGEPYALLLGDYEFDHGPEDVALLTALSKVAAAALAPFIAGAAARMFNCDRFTELPNARQLAEIFTTPGYDGWREFRETEESRFVALAMPRVLTRLPYGRRFTRVDAFNFEESVDGSSHDHYLWMNAAWAYARCVTRAFAAHGWTARIRGIEGGGKVEGLPVHTFPTGDGGVAMKCPTEIGVDERREVGLSNLGFLPLLHCKNTDYAAFLGAPSCQKPRKYHTPEANAHAELSTKINFLLCASRFAHYVKVMARGALCGFLSPEEVERWLNAWLADYVRRDGELAGEAERALRPLAAARLQIRAVPGAPGRHQAILELVPCFQVEELSTPLRLVTEVPTPFGPAPCRGDGGADL